MFIDEMIISKAADPICSRVWVPEETYVVLGRSNKAESELNIKAIEAESIPILRRKGGGGAVVLYPGCLIIGLGLWVADYYENQWYFNKINDSVIHALHVLSGNKCLSQNGISDICVGEKKIAGTSLFRSRNYLLYQASVIVRKDIKIIETCLKHPTQEPAYRQRKSHSQFLGSLAEIAPGIQLSEVSAKFEPLFLEKLQETLKSKLISPVNKQVDYLLGKLNG